MISPILTDYEYHRDRLDYENSIASKKFRLQLLNTFASFYYIAFLMRPWGDHAYHAYGGPSEYLTYEMFVTFASYLALAAFDIVSPVVHLWMSVRKNVNRLKELGQ